MNCLIRVHPICNNIGSIGVHFGIELAFYIIRYLTCLNVLVKCYQTPAQRRRALTNSLIDTVMHYHIYRYNRPSAIGHQPSAIGHQPSAIGNHRWYLAKKAVPTYIHPSPKVMADFFQTQKLTWCRYPICTIFEGCIKCMQVLIFCSKYIDF